MNALEKVNNLKNKETNKEEVESFLDIKKTYEQAEESERPYLVSNGKDIAVIGDTKDIAPKKDDYSVHFDVHESDLAFFPFEVEEAEEKASGYYRLKITFKDVTFPITHIQTFVQAIIKIMPYFKNVELDNNEKVLKRHQEEIAVRLYQDNAEDFLESCRVITGIVLGIDKRWRLTLPTITLQENTLKIIQNNLDLINQAESFLN